ncbi:MAG TPA: DNA starvation/stationary phase protection protein [Solirubrobacteraceae bacterium]|jgi:starvation-inducible DNA-binding protein|nr:DNA starvation/stationary phase protection protein [Solirubrobacteraceae bacterium]
MASTAQSAHLPALGEHQLKDVGNTLQAMLVELIDLALLGKQLHWNVTGPLFRPLHEQLDELVDSWRELSDVVAERAVALGYAPDGQAPAVAAVTELKPIARGALEDHVVIRELSERMNDVADRARERMDRLGEIDAASQDVIIEVVRALEKQLWMIRVQFGHVVQG